MCQAGYGAGASISEFRTATSREALKEIDTAQCFTSSAERACLPFRRAAAAQLVAGSPSATCGLGGVCVSQQLRHHRVAGACSCAHPQSVRIPIARPDRVSVFLFSACRGFRSSKRHLWPRNRIGVRLLRLLRYWHACVPSRSARARLLASYPSLGPCAVAYGSVYGSVAGQSSACGCNYDDCLSRNPC